MKKLLLSVFALASYVTVNAQCSELFISEYVEGSGYDKAIEIYNPTNAPINLSGYRIERFSNGASTSGSGGVLNLAGTIAAHDVWVVTNNNTSAPPTSPALTSLADQLDNPYPAPTYMNGNDAIALYKNTTMIDLLGMTGDAAMVSAYGWSDAFPYDGSAGAIWTEDHTLVRKATVTGGVMTNPSPEFIVTTQWDSLPENTWNGLGTHVCNCGTVGISNINQSTTTVVIYPNPADNTHFTVSAAEAIETIEVYNLVGQLVISQTGNNGNKQAIVETGTLTKGVYAVKMKLENNKTSVVKITIQ